jgi:hypothetical protein
MRMASNGHDSDETDAAREDGLRVVPEGYDPQQVHELLAGYKAQMDRLEQVLGSVQAALGASEERPAGEDFAPPDNQALQLAADYRPSSLRFDPTPISMRVAPGAAQGMQPRPRHSGLIQRFVLEGAFLVLVVLSLSILQEPKKVILAGAAAAWLVVIFVEVLLSRLQSRVVSAPFQQAPVAAPPTVARPEVVALRLPHAQEPTPAAEALLPPEQEPVDAVTGPDDVWVVPQEVLIAEPVLDEEPEDEPQAQLLEDTLETDVAPEEVDDEPEPADDPAESEPDVEEAEPVAEAVLEPEPAPVAETEPEPTADAEPLLPGTDDGPAPEPEWPEAPLATDSWEPIFEPEPVAQNGAGSRRWPFGRHGAEPAATLAQRVPPDPELGRVTHPLPPVLIDPNAAAGNGNGKRRTRRRRG